VLTCTGTIPQIKKAVALVVYKICEDPSAAYTNMTTQYSRYLAAAGPPRGMGGMGFGSSAMSGYGASGGMAGMAPMGGMGMDQAYAQQMAAYGGADPYGGYGAAATYGMDPSQFGGPPSYGAPAPSAAPGGGTTYTIYVPDMAVSAILGRGGVVIKEMMEQSGKFWKPVKPTPRYKRCIASLCRFALLFFLAFALPQMLCGQGRCPCREADCVHLQVHKLRSRRRVNTLPGQQTASSALLDLSNQHSSPTRWCRTRFRKCKQVLRSKRTI